MRHRHPGSLCGVLLLLITTAVAGAADSKAPSPIPEDHYRAGKEPAIDQPVLGDLSIAGLRPRVKRRVAGDLLAAGGWLTVTGEIGDDIRAAGAWLNLDSRVGDHAALAGFRVVVGGDADIGGRAWIRGDYVHVDGRVRGALDIAGREVVLSGRIDGPARITADRLEIRSSARINGDLVYRAPEKAAVDPGATIDDRLTHQRSPRSGIRQRDGTGATGAGAMVLLVWTLALLIPGVVLRLTLPSHWENGRRTLARKPVFSLAIGALVLLVGPLAALFLCIFVVTIPLALAALMMLAPFALAGCLLAAATVGDLAVRRLARRRHGQARADLAALALSLAGLVIATMIPWVGWLIPLGATLIGTGAAVIATGRRLRTTG